MITPCPNCKKDVDHEDYLFEVVCTQCMSRFNPFMPAEEPAAEGAAAPEFTSGPADFQESQRAFQDIVAFGETLEEPKGEAAPSGDATPASAPGASAAAPRPAAPARSGAPAAATFGAVGGECPVLFETAPPSVVRWLDAVAAWAELDPAAADPFANAFEKLRAVAQAKGANAVVNARWEIADGGRQVFLAGNAVVIEKTSGP